MLETEADQGEVRPFEAADFEATQELVLQDEARVFRISGTVASLKEAGRHEIHRGVKFDLPITIPVYSEDRETTIGFGSVTVENNQIRVVAHVLYSSPERLSIEAGNTLYFDVIFAKGVEDIDTFRSTAIMLKPDPPDESSTPIKGRLVE